MFINMGWKNTNIIIHTIFLIPDKFIGKQHNAMVNGIVAGFDDRNKPLSAGNKYYSHRIYQ